MWKDASNDDGRHVTKNGYNARVGRVNELIEGGKADS